ncbi:lactonase family protein [Salinicola aestuarinus]|uniref:lactonase family protein n=1 Tax=Salinicola aestuarinus TaxID=1949082 RepID=UPI000DA19F12|nr:beta-propeller fold lactonase family protein [Salinicola aestuarinus]
MSTAPERDTLVYIANASDGTIGRYRLDRQTETLESLGTTDAGKNVMPLAVSPDQRYLYAAVRSEPLRVLSYRIDADSGDLAPIGSGSLSGSMAYIAVDRSGRYLLAASYGDSCVSVSPIDEHGVAGDAIQTEKTGANAHAIQASPDNRHVIATSLGEDHLSQFHFDGTLTANTPARVDTDAQQGPRHFVFSPCGRFVYVLGEFTADVTTFAFDAESGELTRLSVCHGLPENAGLERGMRQQEIPEGDETRRVWAADLHLTPDGRYLYLSERTSSTLSRLHVDPNTGEARFVASQPTVERPRGFEIDPLGGYLIAVGELSDRAALYRIDSADGALEHVSDAPVGNQANWVEIVTFD